MRPALSELGIGITGENIAARRCQKDCQDCRPGQSERDGIARCQGRGHKENEERKKNKFHGRFGRSLRVIVCRVAIPSTGIAPILGGAVQ